MVEILKLYSPHLRDFSVFVKEFFFLSKTNCRNNFCGQFMCSRALLRCGLPSKFSFFFSFFFTLFRQKKEKGVHCSFQSFLFVSGQMATLESVQDFLIKLDIKPLMHLLEISTFSLKNVIGRLTKIMNRADKNWAHF